MHTELFQSLGLAQNEARIYETLLRHGECSVGEIATHSMVHRRNVYDSLARLVEKGLTFEIIEQREIRYQAVEPEKLADILEEKQRELQKVLPELEALYAGTPHIQGVYLYRGLEGWKNYMREVLRIGEDVFAMGAKAPMNQDTLKSYFHTFKKELARQEINYYCLYDADVEGTKYEGHLSDLYRFLPPEASTDATTIILSDRIFLFSNITVGAFGEDIAITVVVDKQLAQAQQKWFWQLWEHGKVPKKASSK